MAIFNTVYGGEWSWKPGSNTIAYYKLETDTKDYSGNNRDLTNSGVTFVSSIGGATIPVGYFNGSSRAYINWTTQLNTGYTISLWQKGNTGAIIFDLRNNNEYGQGVMMTHESGYFKLRQQKASNAEEEYSRTDDNNRNHWVLTWTGSVWTIYFNGTQVKQATINNSINTSNSNLSLGSRYSGNTNNWTGYISNFIVESSVWSAQEVLNYYNKTKSNYGL